MVTRQILEVQESNDPLDDLANIRGLRPDQCSSFANMTFQLLVLNKTLRGQLQKLPNDHVLKVTLDNYVKIVSIPDLFTILDSFYTMRLNTQI